MRENFLEGFVVEFVADQFYGFGFGAVEEFADEDCVGVAHLGVGEVYGFQLVVC